MDVPGSTTPLAVVTLVSEPPWPPLRSGASSTTTLSPGWSNAGAHYVVPDFVYVQDAGGSPMPMADQVRHAVAWVYKNAKSFGGDPDRLYVGGHSSGGHLAGVVLTTDWRRDFGLPPDLIKGGVCLSGMYDLSPVRLSSRSSYVKFDDAMVEALSSQRHIDKLHAPLIVAYGSYETPEFQRQNREFAAAVKAAGKPVRLIVAEDYSHMEMPETLANPYGVTGFPALRMMHLRMHQADRGDRERRYSEDAARPCPRRHMRGQT